jgi:hypothetical protein
VPDPFRKVRPGERIQIGARAWNAMLDAARAEQGRKSGRTFGDLTTTPDAAIVFVRNDSGADVDRYAVLGLDGPVFDPAADAASENAFLRNVAFSGVTPAAADHRGKFCILFEPAPQDRVVRAYVAGVCPVLVDVLDTGHAYADVTDGDPGGLTSGASGGAQILWKETDGSIGYGYGYTTGVQWALVRIGVVPTGVADFKVTTAVTKRVGTTMGTGAGTMQTVSSAGVYTSTGVSYTLKSKWTDKGVALDAYVTAYYNGAVWEVIDVDDCANLT